jgi:hypothetical protein
MMQEYDIRRGHQKDLEGGKLKALMEEIFGNASEEGGFIVSKFGALDKLMVGWDGGAVLKVETLMNKDAGVDAAASTVKAYYIFLERATGFTSKERGKRLQKKAKEGKL